MMACTITSLGPESKHPTKVLGCANVGALDARLDGESDIQWAWPSGNPDDLP